MDKRDRFRGCIIGAAVGDCLGAPVEFTRDVVVTGMPDDPRYTDDTQMSICVAEALSTCGGDQEAFMIALTIHFIKWYEGQGDPKYNRAPGDTCMQACEALLATSDWGMSGVLDSLDSGSAMRSAPVGLYWHSDLTKVIEFGICSSEITHRHPAALCSSVASAMIASLAMQGVPVGVWGHEVQIVTRGISKEFVAGIQKAVELASTGADPNIAMTKKHLGEGWLGHEAVASALFCCMIHPDNFRRAVLTAANAEGDSDTIACIVGAWMGTRLGLNAIPKEWVERVEDSQKLMELADKLFDASERLGQEEKKEDAK